MLETTCPIPGCSEVFINQDAHNLHIQKVHHISGKRLVELFLTIKKRKAAGEAIIAKKRPKRIEWARIEKQNAVSDEGATPKPVVEPKAGTRTRAARKKAMVVASEGDSSLGEIEDDLYDSD